MIYYKEGDRLLRVSTTQPEYWVEGKIYTVNKELRVLVCEHLSSNDYNHRLGCYPTLNNICWKLVEVKLRKGV